MGEFLKIALFIPSSMIEVTALEKNGVGFYIEIHFHFKMSQIIVCETYNSS